MTLIGYTFLLLLIISLYIRFKISVLVGLTTERAEYLPALLLKVKCGRFSFVFGRISE